MEKKKALIEKLSSIDENMDIEEASTLVLIMVFIIFYIHNRYASQQQQIEIDRLKKELTDIKYDALTRS